MKKCFIFFTFLIIALVIAANVENKEDDLVAVEMAMDQQTLDPALEHDNYLGSD